MSNATAAVFAHPNGAYSVVLPTGEHTFVPPLTLRPLTRLRPFRPHRAHGMVRATNVQGHTLPAFSWANMADVRRYRFAPGTALPAQMINSPPDQGNCGSCWIVSSTTMSSDRLAIATLQSPLTLDIVDLCCAEGMNGCDGGDAGTAFQLMSDQTLRDGTCNVYANFCAAGYHCTYEGFSLASNAPPECSCSSRQGKQTPKCGILATVDSYYTLDDQTDIKTLQNEIFENGPVVCAFMATKTLLEKYNCRGKNPEPFDGTGDQLGGHAVVCVGWGYDKQRQRGYWVVRNSWGTQWNGDGYWNFWWGAGLENSAMGPPAWWTVKPAAARVGDSNCPNTLSVASKRLGKAPTFSHWQDYIILAFSVAILVAVVVAVGRETAKNKSVTGSPSVKS